MSTKKENVVCRASYCKVFSGIFWRVSFSTATPGYNSCFLFVRYPHAFDALMKLH